MNSKESKVMGTFPVLDHGFVRLVDYMGSDISVVDAARVSYGQGRKSAEEDKALISYLMRHGHLTPFEMCELKFHVKMPIFVARQWVRHRTASINEISGRYTVMSDECFVPDVSAIRYQSKTNKQGSDNTPLDGETADEVHDLMTEFQKDAFESYHEILDKGIARELARINLPLSTYTQWYWKMDLRNLLHFLQLRLHPHAQVEIRQYARVIAQIVEMLYPWTWEAFEDHVLAAITFSRPELKELRRLLRGQPEEFPRWSDGQKREYKEKVHSIIE